MMFSSSKITIPHFELVPIDQKEILRQELFTYLEELGFKDKEYSYFDLYWKEPSRFPIYFYLGKTKIGFALINNHTYIQNNKPTFSVAEFCIFKTFRKNNYGAILSHQLFDYFRGFWEVSVLLENQSAEIFWEKIIAQYDPSFSKYENHKDWDGCIFTFQTRSISKSLNYVG